MCCHPLGAKSLTRRTLPSGTATYWWNNTFPFRALMMHTPYPHVGDTELGADVLLQHAAELFDPPHPAQLVDGRPVEDAPGEERAPPDSVVLEGDVGEAALDWTDGRVLHWAGEERQQNVAWTEALNAMEEKKALLEVRAVQAFGVCAYGAGYEALTLFSGPPRTSPVHAAQAGVQAASPSWSCPRATTGRSPR